MATLTIKNLPDEIYTTLSKTAKQNRRSINGEAIVQLENALHGKDQDREKTLERIRETRRELLDKGVWLTDEILQFARNEGRP
ncbi:MAG: plasmid stability protein [Pyrinomonadaceae bacterium]